MGQIQDCGVVEITLQQERQRYSHPNTGLAVGSAVGASEWGDGFLLVSSVGAVEGDGPRWMGTIKSWPYHSTEVFRLRAQAAAGGDANFRVEKPLR